MTARDLPRARALLEQLDLPSADADQWQLAWFLVIVDDDEFIAMGGAEHIGEYALLRSVATSPRRRREGFANAILVKIEKGLAARGVREIYLLTEHAEDYFRARGFKTVERSRVPFVITQTRQFTELCPTTAVVMRKVVAGV